MKTQIPGVLAEEAPARLPAPSDEKVIEGIVFGEERKMPVRAKVVEAARAADDFVREHPLEMIAIVFTIGALLGGLAARVCHAARI